MKRIIELYISIDFFTISFSLFHFFKINLLSFLIKFGGCNFIIFKLIFEFEIQISFFFFIFSLFNFTSQRA